MSTALSTRGGQSPLGLRLVHAGVFLALAASVLSAGAGEWRDLVCGLTRAFHAGPAPRGLLLAGALLAALGGLRLLGALAQRRTAPLWASVLVLASVVLAMLSGGGGLAAERSEGRANLAFLEVGRRVQLAMVGALQQQGEVPREAAAWARVLADSSACHGCVRDRLLRAQAPRVVRVAAPDALPAEPLVPGALLAWVSEDGVAFALRLVGFGEAGPALLRDPEGGVLVLEGLFNPDPPTASELTGAP